MGNLGACERAQTKSRPRDICLDESLGVAYIEIIKSENIETG